MSRFNVIELLEPRCLLSADLAVSFVGRVPTTIPAAGRNRIAVQLANRGDATAVGLATIQLYASTTPSLDSDSLLLGSVAPQLNLKVGKSIKPTITFNSPANLASGSYYVIATVIPGFIEDGDANDLAASGAVRFTRPFVDLTDTVVMTPASAKYTVGGKAQKPIKFTLTIRNSGSIAAKGLAAVNLFGSADTTLDEFDPSLQSFGVKRLNINPGKTAKFILNWKPTAATQSGTFFGLFQINGNKGVAETDATNNIAATSTELTIINAAKPIVPSLAGPLSDNITVVVVGSPETVHFSAIVRNASPTTLMEVDETNAAGTVISKITDLLDNGSHANADATAGDGVFSGVVPISYSTSATRYFAAKLVDATAASASQTAPLPIPGALPLTDAQFAQDDADANSVMQAATASLQGGGSIPQIIAAVSATLQSDSAVLSSSVENTDDGVAWLGQDGVGQVFSIDALLGERGASATPSASPALARGAQPADTFTSNASGAPSAFSAAADSSSGNYGDGNAVVLAPMLWNFTTADEAPSLASTLTANGYSVTQKADETATSTDITLDDFEHLAGNDAIVITSHGYLSDDFGQLLDSNVLSSNDPPANHSADLLNHRLIDFNGAANGKSYAMAPSFFTEYLGSLDGTIVYLGACNTAAKSDLADAFLNAGAAAVVGYTQPVTSGFAFSHSTAMFNTLLGTDKNTIGDVPGINVDVDPVRQAMFKSFGDLSATLPKPVLLKNFNLVVTYNWPANQKDLDSKTVFAGAAAGFNLNGGTYLKWLGDNQGEAGSETTVVDLYDAWATHLFDSTTTVTVGADWYTPDDGAGPAVINVALEEIHTQKQIQIQSLTIQPGEETDGATSQQGIVKVQLTGTATEPSVKIALLAAGAV